MGKAIVVVTYSFLHSVLDLPHSTYIDAAECDIATDCVKLRICDDRLPKYSEGERLPEIDPPRRRAIWPWEG